MAMDPWYAIYRYNAYTKYLQADAIADIMAINPVEKYGRLATYGLSPPCRSVVWAVLKGMTVPLTTWARKFDVRIHDLQNPWFRPEVFRLETGCALWPSPGRIVVLMPLSTGSASIELLPRGTNYGIPAPWVPNVVLFLNETGIRFTGSGYLRFIYIFLHKSPDPSSFPAPAPTSFAAPAPASFAAPAPASFAAPAPASFPAPAPASFPAPAPASFPAPAPASPAPAPTSFPSPASFPTSISFPAASGSSFPVPSPPPRRQKKRQYRSRRNQG